MIPNTSLMPRTVTVGKREADGSMSWMPPNDGRYAVRHIDTFINRYSSLSNTYRDSDEALLDSRTNSKTMRKDLSIRECLDSRQRSVALLNWHIEPQNDKSADQREFCDNMENIIRSISHFYQYRFTMQQAIWYGKFGIQHRWGIKNVAGKSIYMPAGRHQDDWGWRPLHGDKIVYRQLRTDWNMPDGTYEGQTGIRVGYRFDPGNLIDNRWKVESTDFGLAYFLSPAERRKLLAVHKHYIEDAAFDDGLRAGSINGVGIRDVVYWEWVQKQETMAFLMEFLERMAGGIQVWKYPSGNPQAETEVRKAAEQYNSGEEHVLLVPVPPGEPGQYGVEVVDPGFSGVDILHKLLQEYFDHRIKRYILGQVLTSEAEATGMGSGVAEAHMDTLLQILQSDALNSQETLTTDLVQQIINVNIEKGVWQDPGFTPRFVIETEEDDVEAKLQSVIQLSDRGLPFKQQDIYQMIGMAQPNPGDAVFLGKSAGGPPGPDGQPPEPGAPPDASGMPPEHARDLGPAREPGDDPGRPKDDQQHRYSRRGFKRSAFPGRILIKR